MHGPRKRKWDRGPRPLVGVAAAMPAAARFLGKGAPSVPAPTPAPVGRGRSTFTEGWWEAAFPNPPTNSELRGHPCGAKQMLTLVAYDITDHKRLTKVAKHCEDYGVRIQYSIFECRLEAGVFDRFWEELEELIDPETDRLVAYKICVACAKDIRSAGTQIHHEKVVAYVF